MKFAYIILILWNCIEIYTKPTENNKVITYINQPNDGSGNYYFLYKTEDGSFREESGEFKNGILVVTGMYAYKTSDDKEIKVTYQADELGYRIINVQDVDNRFSIPTQKPIDGAVLCSLLGRCAEEGKEGNVSPEGSV